MLNNLKYYFSLWVRLSSYSFMSSLTNRFSAAIFLFGKSLRFILFLVFLLTILSKTKFLEQYDANQVVLFYLTFNLIDTISQLFFREVYRFRGLITSGDFDLTLVKPFNPLFRALAGGADPLDLIMLVPYLLALFYLMFNSGVLNLLNLLVYLVLLMNSLLIAAGFHILVLALAILTTEIDHTIMIYRDIVSMGRLPVDIYHEPLRSLITFIIPVGLMMTFPVKAFLGLVSPIGILTALLVGIVFVLICLSVWRYALTQYSSASS